MNIDIAEKEQAGLKTATAPKRSLLGLVRSLRADAKIFLRQEMELAKAEAAEKTLWLARNAIFLAAGGCVALVGLAVFITGLGWLLGWVLQTTGMPPLLAGFVGLAVMGIIVAAGGTAFVLKSLKMLSSDSLAPQRTIQTLRRFKGIERPAAVPDQQVPVPRPSSKEIQARVEQTEDRLGQTIDELGRRLSPQQINNRLKERIQHNPYQTGLIAMAAGVVSGLWLSRDNGRAAVAGIQRAK